MTWTTPRTWIVNELVGASDMNEQVRDNLTVLKTPPSDEYTGHLTDSTSSSSWTDIDATNLSFTITTYGGNLLIGYTGYRNSFAYDLYFDVDIDGTRVSGDASGLIYKGQGTGVVSFVVVETGLSAASHTIKMQFKADGVNAGEIISTQFWVAEIG